MRSVRWIPLFALVLTVSLPARSQEYHQWELFGGFDYLNVNAGSATLTSGEVVNFQQNTYGWHMTATENKASWIGGIVDVSGDYGNRTISSGSPNASFNVRFNVQAYPILFGPRFYLRKFRTISVFGEPTIGLVVSRINVASASAVSQFSGLFPQTQPHWAYALGGGADYDLTEHLALRIQADWIRSHFPQTLARDFQNNYRIGGGLVFRFP